MTASAPPAAKTERDPMALLTLIAMAIALITVAVRMTMTEAVRSSLDFSDAFANLPAAPGATTTLLLDLLCWVPAVLILVRRAIDPEYVLRLHWSHLPMLLLAAWVWASTFWAGDRFAAVVNASTFSAAMAMAWAASQLVRSWTRLRGVLAICFGLLMILIAQSLIYRYFELPETIKEFENNKQQIFAANHWTDDDPIARMYEQKLQHGEVIGFFKSPNTLAAAVALAGFVTAGFAGQRLLDRDPKWFGGVMIAAAVAGVGVMGLAGSRTAIAGSVLFAGLLAAAWLLREKITPRATALFWAGCAAFVAGVGIVLAIGLSTGGLIQDSLNFRWNYWVASWKVFLDHPIAGVGWSSFGNSYLKYRLAVATEEIKDPHDFIVHFLVETGLVGVLLLIAWIGRSWFELTRPIQPRAAKPETGTMLPMVAIITAAYFVLRIVAGGGLSFLPTELLKLVLFAVLLLLGMVLAGVRGVKDLAADARPAPFLLYATLAGLGGFLLHNLVDFPMFENGPLMLFVLVLGAALGVRHGGVAGKRMHTGAAVGGLAVVFLWLLTQTLLVIVPIGSAELKAADAEAAANDKKYGSAVSLYREAMAASPVPNADYAMKAARFVPPDQTTDIAALYMQAIAADPSALSPWLALARLNASQHGDPVNVISAYGNVLALNPNDPTLRVEYGGYLDSIGKRAEAIEQFQKALAADKQMHEDEPRRLPANQRAALAARIQRG